MKKRWRLLGGQKGYGLKTYRKGTPKQYKHTAIFRAADREQVVNRIIDIMNDWRFSPFENEGAVRQSLRATLCLRGHSWQASDTESAMLINEAFNIMGAKRPSFDEAQREYTIPSDNCAWCWGFIANDGLTAYGRRGRYCSVECAKAAKLARDGEWNERQSATARTAALVIGRQKFQKIKCLNCQKDFLPYRMDSRGRKFCSFECAGSYRREIPEKTCPICKTVFWSQHRTQIHCSRECAGLALRVLEPRSCLNCFSIFRPKDRDQKFCCLKCRDAYGKHPNYLRSCAWCGKTFLGKHSTSKFCSNSCKSMDYQQRTGRKNLKRPKLPDEGVFYLTPSVFDYFFAGTV